MMRRGRGMPGSMRQWCASQHAARGTPANTLRQRTRGRGSPASTRSWHVSEHAAPANTRAWFPGEHAVLARQRARLRLWAWCSGRGAAAARSSRRGCLRTRPASTPPARVRARPTVATGHVMVRHYPAGFVRFCPTRRAPQSGLILVVGCGSKDLGPKTTHIVGFAPRSFSGGRSRAGGDRLRSYLAGTPWPAHPGRHALAGTPWPARPGRHTQPARPGRHALAGTPWPARLAGTPGRHALAVWLVGRPGASPPVPGPASGEMAFARAKANA
jgi:hypothetical protein